MVVTTQYSEMIVSTAGGVCIFVNNDKVSVATVTTPTEYSHVEIIVGQAEKYKTELKAKKRRQGESLDFLCTEGG
jgi:hypothetical protein